MSGYTVKLLDAALRDLARLDKTIARRVLKRLEWFSAHLTELTPESLVGDWAGFYKLRVGDYRVLYEILDSERVIVLHIIAHRRDVYRAR